MLHVAFMFSIGKIPMEDLSFGAASKDSCVHGMLHNHLEITELLAVHTKVASTDGLFKVCAC